jgi:hypothetical protein
MLFLAATAAFVDLTSLVVLHCLVFSSCRTDYCSDLSGNPASNAALLEPVPRLNLFALMQAIPGFWYFQGGHFAPVLDG